LGEKGTHFFSCVSHVSRLPYQRSGIAGRRGECGNFRREFRVDKPWIAEPDRCTEPPIALGTGALEFGSFDKSGLGGR